MNNKKEDPCNSCYTNPLCAIQLRGASYKCPCIKCLVKFICNVPCPKVINLNITDK